VSYAANETTGTGRIRDISSGGLFMEVAEPLRIGDPIAIDFRFRHGNARQGIFGVVARVDWSGVGVRFVP
jgi:hypothetical protein